MYHSLINSSRELAILRGMSSSGVSASDAENGTEESKVRRIENHRREQ